MASIMLIAYGTISQISGYSYAFCNAYYSKHYDSYHEVWLSFEIAKGNTNPSPKFSAKEILKKRYLSNGNTYFHIFSVCDSKSN